MGRWSTCCVPGCGAPGTVKYRRQERGPDGAVRSTRTRYVCGRHDYVLRQLWDQLFELVQLRHPEELQLEQLLRAPSGSPRTPLPTPRTRPGGTRALAVGARRLAVLDAEEDAAWQESFVSHKNDGDSDGEADRQAWHDVCLQFERLRDFDGIDQAATVKALDASRGRA